MGSDDRRPRRILGPQEAFQAMPAPAPEPGLQLLQQRFLRALVLPRRAAVPQAERAAVRAAAPRAGEETDSRAPCAKLSCESPAPAARMGTAPAAAGPRQRREAAARSAAGAGASAGMQWSAHEPPPQPDLLSLPEAWRLAGLSCPAPEGWDEDLANRVARLCRRADPAFQSWQVTVPLDPEVLPATELHMALSRERLALRFHTQSPYSQALVSRHSPRLVAMLSRALPQVHDVDLETT